MERFQSPCMRMFRWYIWARNILIPAQDVTMATLYVSSKMHDTLKKPRDLLMVSYGVRYPELAAKAKHGGEVDMDPNVCNSFLRPVPLPSFDSNLSAQTVEADRRRLLAVERLVMETICFNFRVRLPFPYVIKVARELQGMPVPSLPWFPWYRF